MGICCRNDIISNYAKGRNFHYPVMPAASVTGTAAVAASGYHIPKLYWNIGSTVPTSLIGLTMPTGITSNLRLTHFEFSNSSVGSLGCWLVQVYLVGTLNLAATGDQFTHNAATFPILRTQFGQSSQPLSLIPMIHVTTATTTTAPVIRLRTAAGGAGYTDQDGNSVVGAKTITFPSATTATDSLFVPLLEYGDSAVRDIVAIEVTTAAAAGAANVYLVELLCPLNMVSSLGVTAINTTGPAICIPDICPGTATSGTVTSYLSVLSLGVTSAASTTGFLNAVYNP